MVDAYTQMRYKDANPEMVSLKDTTQQHIEKFMLRESELTPEVFKLKLIFQNGVKVANIHDKKVGIVVMHPVNNPADVCVRYEDPTFAHSSAGRFVKKVAIRDLRPTQPVRRKGGINPDCGK